MTSCAKRQTNCGSSSRNFPRPARNRKSHGVAGSGKQPIPEELKARLEEEVGDLFFVLVNIARYLSLDSESALKKTNRKFRRRFQWMEERLREAGRGPADATFRGTGNIVAAGKGARGGKCQPMIAITVRSCRGLDELRACVALQKTVWNFSDADLVPLRMFVVARKLAARS